MAQSPEIIGFFMAAADGDLHGMNDFIKGGVDINVQDSNNGRTALHKAVINGQTAIVKRLLELGADYQIRQHNSFSPFMHATQYGHTNIMKLLVAQGAITRMKQKEQEALFVCAAQAQQDPEEVLNILLNRENGMPPQVIDSIHKHDLLVTALRNTLQRKGTPNHPRTLAALINRGCPRDWVNEDGDTVLHLMVGGAKHKADDFESRGHRLSRMITAFKHALNAGVSPFIVNKQGICAFEYAAKVPEMLEQCRNACSGFAMDITCFNPAKTPLLRPDGTPNDLTLYSCCMGRLDELLTPEHWADKNELLKVKLALGNTLSQAHCKQYAAGLDTASLQRRNAAGNVLYLRLRRPNERGVG